MEQQLHVQHLLHFCDSKHPLVYLPNYKDGDTCCGCQELVYGSSYFCPRDGCSSYRHHKSCAELPLGLHHPLHPLHPLILFDEKTSYFEKEKSRCQVCNESRNEYTYRCYRCDFNLHIKCAILQLEAKFHDHPLTPMGKSIIFTCDICGKEDKGVPYQCATCCFWIHRRCAIYESISVNEVDELGSSYILKSSETLEDGTELAIDVKHFSHEHDITLTKEEDHINEKCDGCVKAIFPPYYSCANCSFFLHKTCANLPVKKQHLLHQHLLTLFPKASPTSKDFLCDACDQYCNGFVYTCELCNFKIDIQCSLDIFTHKGHKHRLFLSYPSYEQSCSSCGDRRYPLFCCNTCEFALDFKCAKLPQTTMYKQHEHPFTLNYIAEDDSGEYYCDICEEERNPNHWFYYCADCTYPAHPKCILEKYPNLKKGGA